MTMPSAQRYRGFLDALRKNVLAFDCAEHDEQRLAATLAVLQGVALYLQGDEEIADERLARPLGWLESAVNDSGRGASVAALEARCTRRRTANGFGAGAGPRWIGVRRRITGPRG